jgi:CheY-like chemotaxis protein
MTPLVLLVEDDDANRDMLERRLARRRLRVIGVADGELGVRLALQHRPGVILMDLTLKGIDGWEAIRRLKANPETAVIPVIALTGHVSTEDRERALASGCHAFVSKPVVFSNLMLAIEQAVGTASPA